MTRNRTGWLSPDGIFYLCQSYEHHTMAALICDLLYEHFGVTPDDYLLQRGWCRITLSVLRNKEWSIYWERFLTDVQKNFLKKYLEDDYIPVSASTKILWSKEEDL